MSRFTCLTNNETFRLFENHCRINEFWKHPPNCLIRVILTTRLPQREYFSDDCVIFNQSKCIKHTNWSGLVHGSISPNCYNLSVVVICRTALISIINLPFVIFYANVPLFTNGLPVMLLSATLSDVHLPCILITKHRKITKMRAVRFDILHLPYYKRTSYY
jgi:hypothetical protein